MIWIARALWLLCLLFGATAAYVVITNPGAVEKMGFTGLSALAPVVAAVVALGYATSGLLILRHQSGHLIGWLLLAPGTLFAFVFATQTLGGALIGNDDTPAAWLVWISAMAFWPAIILAGPVLALVFPDGRFAGQRWRAASLGFLAFIAIALFVSAVRPSDISGLVSNPLALPALPDWIYALLDLTAPFVIFGLLAVVIGSIVVRFRRSTGGVRQQIKWFTFAVILWAVIFGLTFAFPFNESGLVWLGSFALMPIAVVVAVTRYRLYEIDTLINRTVLYAAVTLLVLAIFGVANLGVQQLAQLWLGGPSVPLAGFLGIVVGMLYGPIRRVVRPMVDRVLPARSLVTILFTDIVGSTEQIVVLGDDRWRILLGRFRTAVRQELSSYSGQEVDTAGDAFFATFQRPTQGVRCAVAIRAAAAQLGIQLRTGLHLGEVEMRGETLTGIEVHAAARVMAAAEPGEILLSAAVREAIKDSQFATTDRGGRELKGVPGSWRLFALDA
jgi:class 3 adenylate cyclase